ncbi:histidine kinase [Ornithinibacter sp.]|jgi:two-component system LytT family sensor kinase|uniref:sensor histidine kinase n=1 Tax=Ornithinibacter sp. TaxID=2862748 RepID=UPI002C696231|nr:histidine kinase [Ornithinibacter sp.]HQX86342.1 histidine kinase [Ornithinibacter sp.]HQZ09375.1 histidine kinase [Ornithinibacter sp.]HRA25184.1 histidine kinase [Ornithinibacter sp.]
MTGSIHWPTAVLVAGTLTLLWISWLLLRRSRRRGFLSEVDRATYATLHTASLASQHLADGLTPDAAERAGRHLLSILGAHAVSLSDTGGVLSWTGVGEHHRGVAFNLGDETRATGRTVVHGSTRITCDDDACPIRAAVTAPLVMDDLVVGTLSAWTEQPSPGLAKATEEVAAWVSSQLALAELARTRTRVMEAELRALRAQISPHFIYNSLAAIASFVRTDPDRARELLIDFADFTRYSLRSGGAFTTLAEELRNVERYLILEQARFGDRLQTSLLIAPEVLPVTVPYLAVQPLVENAVRHGLAGKEGIGRLTITAADRGPDAEISIEDDGIGADPQRIRTILDGAHATDSVGLGNVDARLRQVYGDEFGLVVETAPGAGTKVSFRVPKFAPGIHADG